ncbi:MAG: NYN domain-containing protein, partial [Aestuariivirga sp.]
GFFRKRARLVRAIYYTALLDDADYSPIKPLIDWLDYNGYRVVTKPAKEFTDAMGRRKVKGNMDIELAIDVMQLADNLDHIVLFSGDGDFRSLVAAVQAKGRRVTVVSTLTTRPPMIADDLRRQTDQFIDLADLRDEIGRDPAEREVRQRERAPAPAAAKESFEDFADI